MVKESFIQNSQERPISSVNLKNGSYVMFLSSLPSIYAAASSNPANTIHLYDKSSITREIGILSGHPEGVSHLRTAKNILGQREVLMSCGRDGLVKIWDQRLGAPAIQCVYHKSK